MSGFSFIFPWIWDGGGSAWNGSFSFFIYISIKFSHGNLWWWCWCWCWWLKSPVCFSVSSHVMINHVVWWLCVLLTRLQMWFLWLLQAGMCCDVELGFLGKFIKSKPDSFIDSLWGHSQELNTYLIVTTIKPSNFCGNPCLSLCLYVCLFVDWFNLCRILEVGLSVFGFVFQE